MIEPLDGITARIHETAYVHPAAVLIGEVEIGPESSVWPNTTLRGDDGPIVIGAQTSIQDNTVIHCTQGQSRTTVGSRVTVGHSVVLHGCTIHDECVIGIGAIILDNAVIETGSLVGAGTLIPPGKVVEAGTVVMGNPFRVVRELSDRDRKWIEMGWQEYVKRTAQYRARDGQA